MIIILEMITFTKQEKQLTMKSINPHFTQHLEVPARCIFLSGILLQTHCTKLHLLLHYNQYRKELNETLKPTFYNKF